MDEKVNMEMKFEEFCENTTLHGARHACGGKSHCVYRLLWGLAILGMFVVFSIQFALSLVNYFKYDTFTSIQVKRVNDLEMPSVTICNQNMVKLSSMESHFPYLVDELKEYTLFLSGTLDKEDVHPSPLMKNTSLLQIFTITAPTVNDTFVYCSVKYRKVNCADFLSMHFTTGGLCYTFHSKEYIEAHGEIHINKPGNLYSFELVLDVQPDEYLMTIEKGVGFTVQTHDSQVFPFLFENVFTVGPGNVNYIFIRKEITKLLKEPYNNITCLEEDELLAKGAEMGYEGKYSQEQCLSECFTSTAADCKNCSSYNTGPVLCSLYETVECSLNSFTSLLDSNEELPCDCPPKCESITYSYKLSTSDFPNRISADTAKILNWTVTDPIEMSKRYTQLTIFYESLSYTLIEQFPVVDIIQLLANFGGQMGLYLGASLLTLLEFCDFVVITLIRKIKLKLMDKVKTTVKPFVNPKEETNK